MHVMIRMRLVQRMVGGMSVFLFAAGMVVTVMVMPVVTVDMLVGMMALAMMHIRGSRRINRRDGGRSARTRRCAAARHMEYSCESSGRVSSMRSGHDRSIKA